MKRIFLILLSLLLLNGCSNSNKDNTEDIIEENPIVNIDIEELIIKNHIENMDIDEKIGQLFILGISDKYMDDKTKEFIEKDKIGGYIFFDRNIENIEQIRELNNQIKTINRENNNLPVFISIDEEGGIVSRLKTIYGDSPNMNIFGDINDLDISYKYGELVGTRLRNLGFNLNFAPVMDINSNKENPVIGNRAFSHDKEIVFNNGNSIIDGMNKENIIGCIKHFPGHGNTSMDSHIDIPIIDSDYKYILENELYPFIESINKDIDMIMIGHIMFNNLDDKYPASLSENIIDGLLREELGYDGVVISDDMNMGAIEKNIGLEEAVIRFLKSGGDIALICHNTDDMDNIIDRIKLEIEYGDISESEIDEKLYRIISLKRKYKLDDNMQDYNMEEIELREREFNKIKNKNR